MSQTTTRTRVSGRGTIAALFACALATCSGCAADRDASLTWAEAETALESPDVKSIKDFYLRLGEKRPTYADPEHWEGFVTPHGEKIEAYETIGEYIKSHYPEYKYPDITPESAKAMLAKELMWKDGNHGAIDRVERLYSQYTKHRTWFADTANWGNPVYVAIFTDGDGTILGWKFIGK